jgi:hypothetical protein
VQQRHAPAAAVTRSTKKTPVGSARKFNPSRSKQRRRGHLPRKSWFASFPGHTRDFYTSINRLRFAHAPTPERIFAWKIGPTPAFPCSARSPQECSNTCFLHVRCSLLLDKISLHAVKHFGFLNPTFSQNSSSLKTSRPTWPCMTCTN